MKNIKDKKASKPATTKTKLTKKAPFLFCVEDEAITGDVCGYGTKLCRVVEQEGKIIGTPYVRVLGSSGNYALHKIKELPCKGNDSAYIALTHNGGNVVMRISIGRGSDSESEFYKRVGRLLDGYSEELVKMEMELGNIWGQA